MVIDIEKGNGHWKDYEVMVKEGLAEKLQMGSAIKTILEHRTLSIDVRGALVKSVVQGIMNLYYVKDTKDYVPILTEDGEKFLEMCDNYTRAGAFAG
ncbi:MAG: hypothetical protein V1839_01425 [archaeon]